MAAKISVFRNKILLSMESVGSPLMVMLRTYTLNISGHIERHICGFQRITQITESFDSGFEIKGAGKDFILPESRLKIKIHDLFEKGVLNADTVNFVVKRPPMAKKEFVDHNFSAWVGQIQTDHELNVFGGAKLKNAAPKKRSVKDGQKSSKSKEQSVPGNDSSRKKKSGSSPAGGKGKKNSTQSGGAQLADPNVPFKNPEKKGKDKDDDESSSLEWTGDEPIFSVFDDNSDSRPVVKQPVDTDKILLEWLDTQFDSLHIHESTDGYLTADTTEVKKSHFPAEMMRQMMNTVSIDGQQNAVVHYCVEFNSSDAGDNITIYSGERVLLKQCNVMMTGDAVWFLYGKGWRV